jgi:hypothetical protein
VIPAGLTNYPRITTGQSVAIAVVNINAGASFQLADGTFSAAGNDCFNNNGVFVQTGGTLAVQEFLGSGANNPGGGTIQVSKSFRPASFAATGGTLEFTGNGDATHECGVAGVP